MAPARTSINKSFITHAPLKILLVAEVCPTNLRYRQVNTTRYPQKQAQASSFTSAQNASMVRTVGCGAYACHFRSARIQYTFQLLRVFTQRALATGCSCGSDSLGSRRTSKISTVWPST